MPLVVSRKVTFLAKSEYFTSPGLKGFIKKLTFIALGQVPIDRSGGKRSEAALLTGLRLLKENHCLGIYPEGTRSPDGRLYKGRTGIARMAIESGAPIVPVAMYNTAEIQPTGQIVPKVRRVEMVFGEPMYFTGDSTDLDVLREATNKLMEKIAELSGQEYVPNMYASEAKDAIKKSREDDDQIEAKLVIPSMTPFLPHRWLDVLAQRHTPLIAVDIDQFYLNPLLETYNQ